MVLKLLGWDDSPACEVGFQHCDHVKVQYSAELLQT